MSQATDQAAAVMAARTLAPEVRAARIAACEAELALLHLAPFVEYPKMLPDKRVVHSAEEEAKATEPGKAAPKVAPKAEPKQQTGPATGVVVS